MVACCQVVFPLGGGVLVLGEGAGFGVRKLKVLSI